VPGKIVCSYNLTEPSGLFTLVGAWLVRAKMVAFVMDIHVPGETVPATLARRLDYWLQRTLLPHLDGLVVASSRIVEDLAPNARYIRIDGGMDQRALGKLSDSTNEERPADGPFTIAFAGSLTDINGTAELIHAFSLLRGDGYRLRIAGAGPLQDQVRAAAAADSRIEYCGYLSLDQVYSLYQSADVLVNMRLTRKVRTGYFFPSKVIEMLASGVPVITTCTGHIEEEYAGIAFLLREETAEALAGMSRRVASMDPRDRTEMGQAAQAYIKTHNTWEEQGRRVVAFIRRDVLDVSQPGGT
jgi:glycosyltransferase involved in cell wall biosynthesis